LTEEIITTLVNDGVPINSWGVGTNLVTGGNQSALGGVYKLAAKRLESGVFQPTIKVSNSYAKTTNPGIKQIYRFYGPDELAIADLITLDDEDIDDMLQNQKDIIFYHPFTDGDLFVMRNGKYTRVEKLLNLVMKDGKICMDKVALKDIQTYAKESQGHFHRSYKRLINPHIYKVSLSRKLKDLKHELILKAKGINE
ncbi:MAG: nicotinate phosphoribosyltransferase, partial [Spirochaetales bacterium]|nr:nicotinate phosphoribosyltransferase [Spirochaetales bacterium]